MGYRLQKSFTRDPDDPTFGGYQILDEETYDVVAGHGNAGRGYALRLSDVREWIAKRR
jgi:hypothetical protein